MTAEVAAGSPAEPAAAADTAAADAAAADTAARPSALLAAITVLDGTADLEHTRQALLAQGDPSWQWLIVTVGDRALFDEVAAATATEPRIEVIDGSTLSRAQAAMAALDVAHADFLLRLDAGDFLDPGLVGRVRELDAESWGYTDEGLPYADGTGMLRWFKPDFCPELLRSQPYLVRTAILPTAVVRRLGGLSAAGASAQWYDLVLRVADELGPAVHITGPYYLRAAEAEPQPAPWLDGTPEDRCRVLARHCDATGIAVTQVSPVTVRGRELGQRLHRRLTQTPRVSVVIPTRGGSSVIYGLRRCHVVELVESMWTDDRYPNLELVIVYDDETPAEVLQQLRELTDGEVVLVPFHGEFHYSRKCNIGAIEATGDYLCLLNDDMRVVTPDWLHEMVSLLDDPEVGAVGPKLLFADGSLQHAGHVYNGGSAGHLLFNAPGDTIDMAGLAQLTGERMGVTGACLLMRRADYLELGGLSELFPLNFNDVDLCLKIVDAGFRILYTPHAVLDHYESQTRQARIDPKEVAQMERRWRVIMHHDRVLNPLDRLPVMPRPDVMEF